MRRFFVLAPLALTAIACGGSAATTSGSSGASAPAPASAVPTSGTNPCAGGTCKVTVTVASELEREFARQQVNYKVYQGCPRSLGVTTPDGLRGVQPLASSIVPAVGVPATLTGRYATIAVFFGSTPKRYLLADFGSSTMATVDFGYQWNGNALQDDLTRVRTNDSFLTRSCRGS